TWARQARRKVELQRPLDLAVHAEVPALGIEARHGAVGEHRPLLGLELAGRQPGFVALGMDALDDRAALESVRALAHTAGSNGFAAARIGAATPTLGQSEASAHSEQRG